MLSVKEKESKAVSVKETVSVADALKILTEQKEIEEKLQSIADQTTKLQQRKNEINQYIQKIPELQKLIDIVRAAPSSALLSTDDILEEKLLNDLEEDETDEEDIEDAEDEVTNTNLSPQETRLIMPKNLPNDVRITRVYIDLPNIVNSISIEPKNMLKVDPYFLDRYKAKTKAGDYLIRVEAEDIRKLFAIFIEPFDRAEVTVYTTPHFQMINKCLDKLDVEYKKQGKSISIILQEFSNIVQYERNGKKFDDYADIDKDMESDMLDDAFEKGIPPNKYNRIILMSGDRYFLSALEHFNPRIKIHIVAPLIGMHRSYRKFTKKRNASIKNEKASNGELPVMYHGFLASDIISKDRLDRYYQRSLC